LRILVVGSGAREHALAWAMRRSARVSEVFVAPGNAGTDSLATNVDIASTDIGRLVAFARDRRVDLTVVGPEAPLVAGIVDSFRDEGLLCYGPAAAAARLEGSKAFAKEFMRRHEIPTARFAVFDDPAPAAAYARSLGSPLVVKADGLAAGKGVVVAASAAEAERAIDAVLVKRRFGDSGARVVVEEFLSGEEVSIHAVCAGRRAVLLPSSQDHKRAYDGDRGPNTGGMGAVAPVSWMTRHHLLRVRETIIQPVLDGMAAEGAPFSGTLYAGLMWTASGPKVLEFNVRFGDPEAEALMPLFADDLASLLEAAARGRLADGIAEPAGASAAVVIASRGYPEHAESGVPVAGLDDVRGSGVVVFHAGTRLEGGRVLSAGGRVLAVTAWARDLRGALEAAYAAAARIHIDGAFYRRDIGWRQLAASEERTNG
jgi:phosphoribosylamine--glycine ligase